jgi:hypothetical protein
MQSSKYKANFRLTQMEKTGISLRDATQRYILNTMEIESNTHVIEIIVTNKSLPETEQWKIRTRKEFSKFENITIDILSSRSDDYQTMDPYITKLQRSVAKKDPLPHILIMCFHPKRIEEIENLLISMKNYKVPHVDIKFHISLDEPDANLGVTKKFLKANKEIIETDLVIGITFITATPDDKFWKIMNKEGIVKLLNLNQNDIDIEYTLENYRPFSEHSIIEFNNETQNPLSYLIDVFANRYIRDDQRNIIYAPAHRAIATPNMGCHDDFVSYAKEKGYCVLLINGIFKGFKYPDGTNITIEQFNENNKISGELRETLAKWNIIHPKMSLLITGHNCIERGITFNTDGFNFTHMVLSNYHALSLNKIVQMAGRATGKKQYVNKMIVICTSKVKNMVVDFNQKLTELCSLKPESFNKTDFKTAQKSPAIPVKVEFLDNDYKNNLFKLIEEKKSKYKVRVYELLLRGIEERKIHVDDRNNKPLNIKSRKIKDTRMYKNGDNDTSRRFKQFKNAYDSYHGAGQTGDEKTFNIDVAKDDYITGDFYNSSNIAWITYRQ